MIADNLGAVRQRITAACGAAGRCVQSVTLVSVSKTVDAPGIREAFAAGAADFGENYAKEAIAKIDALADLRERLTWHMIGPLQSNKTNLIAKSFDWVHSIDRLRIAERLSEQRPRHLAPLQVCIQVNVSGEASKSGVASEELFGLVRAMQGLTGLRLRGLMSIPQPVSDPAAQRIPHRSLKNMLVTLNALGFGLDTLSMGMTADLEAAILEGATIVRVGTAVFGSRPAAAPF